MGVQCPHTPGCAAHECSQPLTPSVAYVTMMDMGNPLHLIDLLTKVYRKQLAKVNVAGTLSEWFRVKKGVRQGCVLSPYLFNIRAGMVMRETLDEFQGRLQSGGRNDHEPSLR